MDKHRVKLDWQHAVLIIAAACGGIACIVDPALAHLIGPALSAVVPLALAKKSPLDHAPAGAGSDDDIGVTIINVGEPPPKNIAVTSKGGIEIHWQTKQ